MKPSPSFPVMAVLVLLLASSGCMVGPRYKRPRGSRTADVQRAAAGELQRSGSGRVEAVAACRRVLERPMVGALQRCGTECARGAGRRFEPECSAG